MLKSLVIVVAVAVASSSPALAGQTDAPERAAASGDKVICKRFAETGSLVRVSRVCKPKRDWERERDAIRSGGTVSDSCRNRAEPDPIAANGGGCGPN